MRCLLIIGILIAGISLPGLARSDGAREPEHCQHILIQIENALQKRLQRREGDQDNRVRVALAAHERLGCDPQGLLDALRINRPIEKKTK